MQRCLQLARLGLGTAAPNPMVGSVIVYNDSIIGEGYHRQYGGPHAEVNAIHSVADKELLKKSTLYVNLEPCAHHGKTPPCADLIIEMKIPEVVIGCRDIYAEVNGKGIEKLQKAGVKVTAGVREKESLELNRRFFTFHSKKRPYIILKWAQTADGFIARNDHSSKWISGVSARLMVHKWRSEEAAIMVGTRTAWYDNPKLDSRDMSARNPVRIVLDREYRLPVMHHLNDGSIKTVFIGQEARTGFENKIYQAMDFSSPQFLTELMLRLHSLSIQSVIVEGGSVLISHFINNDLWDEARVFTATQNRFGDGIAAPAFPYTPTDSYSIGSDMLHMYRNHEI